MTMLKRLSGALVALMLLLPWSAQAQTTLDFWSFIDPAGDNVRSKTLAHIIDTFEKANAGVKVKTTVIQWDQISSQLLRADKAGAVPDVVMLYSPNFQTNVQAGNLLPLDKYLAAWSEADRKDIIMLSVAKKDGKIYGLPWELRVLGMAYNAKALRERNMPVPATLDELATEAAALTKDGLVGLAFGFNPADATGSAEWFIPTLSGMGAKVLNDDGTAAFDSPQARKLVQYIYDLVHKYKAVPMDVALSGDEAIQQLAESGRAVFVRTGTHRIAAMREKSKLGNDLQFMPVPSFEKGKRSPALLQGWHAAIPAKAKHPDQAWKFIEHWTSKDIQTYQSQSAGYLPVRESVAKSDAFNTPERMYVREAIVWAHQDPLNFNWPAKSDYLINVLARMFEQVVTQKMPVPDALKWAEVEYNKQVKP